jgi:hypothetical protein
MTIWGETMTQGADREHTSSTDDRTTVESASDTYRSEEDDTAMFFYQVDLHAVESQYNHAPIFTRSLLENIRREKLTIRRMTNIGERYRTVNHLSYETPAGNTYKVWELDPALEQTNRVDVHFMPRVVLHPSFQKHFAAYTKAIPLFWQYNGIQPNEDIHLSVPYIFEVSEVEYLEEHLYRNLMTKYRHTLAHTLRLWKRSSSRAMLQKTMVGATAVSAPVTRIVCFGLG